jgi:hypothetical protein
MGAVPRLQAALQRSLETGRRYTKTADEPRPALTWWDVLEWEATAGLSGANHTIGELAHAAETRERQAWQRQAETVFALLAPHCKTPPDVLALNPYISKEEADELRAKAQAQRDREAEELYHMDAEANFYSQLRRHWTASDGGKNRQWDEVVKDIEDRKAACERRFEPWNWADELKRQGVLSHAERSTPSA